MTKEELVKGNDIIKQIELRNIHLKKVNRWIEKERDVSWYGIRGTCNSLMDYVLFPSIDEISTLLLLMKERLETELLDLEKELEEL